MKTGKATNTSFGRKGQGGGYINRRAVSKSQPKDGYKLVDGHWVKIKD